MESNYRQVYICLLLELLGYFQPRNAVKIYLLSRIPLPFVGTLRIFSAQKCCQNLTFLLEVGVGYSTFCSILTILSTILHGILSKMNHLWRDNNSCKYLSFAETSLIF